MKRYSDSTLMRMTKAELIEQLRCAEHNREVAEEQLAHQAENVKDWVPVVRCKDCKYFLHPTKSVFTACSYDKCGGMLAPKLNDFCSYGVPK